MFSTQAALDKKTGENGVGRYSFLSLLVQEYEQSNSTEARQQVLANLANFAYDPINYIFIKQLKIPQLFLDVLASNDESFLEYAIAGLTNLSADVSNRDFIVKHNGIELIAKFLLHENIEIAINALSMLIFLITDESLHLITTPAIISKVLHYSSSSDPRIKNLGDVFLSDFCTAEQIEHAKAFST